MRLRSAKKPENDVDNLLFIRREPVVPDDHLADQVHRLRAKAAIRVKKLLIVAWAAPADAVAADAVDEPASLLAARARSSCVSTLPGFGVTRDLSLINQLIRP